MKEFKVSLPTTGVSEWIHVDTRGSASHVYSLLVDLESAVGANASVEFCLSKDTENCTAVSHDVLSDVTSTTSSHHESPVIAFRLNVSALSSGSIKLLVLQAGHHGN